MSKLRICPFCKEEGRTSCLTPSLYSTTTCMAASPGHYDERGEWVKGFDPNWRSTSYSCSNGHVFGVSSRDGAEDKIQLAAPRPTSTGDESK